MKVVVDASNGLGSMGVKDMFKKMTITLSILYGLTSNFHQMLGFTHIYEK